MKFEINEKEVKEVKEILVKDDDFKKLFRFKTNLNDRVRFLSNALIEVNIELPRAKARGFLFHRKQP